MPLLTSNVIRIEHTNMSKSIYLRLGTNKYQLASISENINGSPNDFIKVLLNQNTRYDKDYVIKIEFSIHPKKTHLKETISKEVKLFGDYENKITEKNKRNIHYDNIHETLGYENFSGHVLNIYQCNYKTGFPPQKTEIKSIDNDDFISLSIDYDDPFWLGILYCRDKNILSIIFKYKGIDDYKFIKCHLGFIAIAIRKLMPEWEKYKHPKDKSNLGHYTEHETFSL